MVNYRYTDRIGEFSLTPVFLYNIYGHENIIQVNQLIYIYNH